ncbi:MULTISPECIES: adenylate/guanylate cyclase domain-containing protein [unclassified Oceanispirochaeta]|uniref:adenylate/guanylate cyclase domain-containing protein n=1 Tax=unclassified Oceanispirochaeta TaxID=2635722 RepID=UPI000E09251D|nr:MULTISPECIES: adenylate/guanylate cyclase domain-containing protein [unclassified Oceanispirochaeta]MBF9017180.1 adenylate cyclase [Oceanispirochaeta sp. M2]MBF9017183.1 adenylate cyclase [Oceanispirochaeta sp. M2]NPD73629.1 adenylate cyclase [Oceanispirochaeta sp. M1]NPD73632.1 adenylate cyclase [Oceanispirochaeta sp. M1]RDG30558.1 adenylate cyclase [Oceanispirochaeta sp. M1]
MADYDYKEGKTRIKNILNNKMKVNEVDKLPGDDQFTYTNSYYSWVTAIFIDIRDSSDLFTDEDKEKVSKIIRSFSSEIIEILRKNENLREIGIRGDCVYSIFTTPQKSDIYDILQMSFYINTFMKMINKLLDDKDFPNIKVGIGISTSKELVVKAGRKDTGINSKVWIGDAVTKASNLSSLGNRDGYKSIVISYCTYDNIIDQMVKDSGEEAKNWFNKRNTNKYGTIYDANIVKSTFDKWIDDGMKG